MTDQGRTAEGRAIKLLLSTCLGAVLCASGAGAATIRDFDHLALAPDGSKIVNVEDSDPGNLPDEPHGAVVVRGADGNILAQYDPCKACQYSDTAWSPKSDAFAFVGFDRAAGKATVYVVAKGSPRAVTTVSGVVNTLRWSPDGTRLAMLATLGAHKRTGAVEAGAALVGKIGEATDEQRIAIVPVPGGTPKLVSPADTYIYEYDWAPDGKGFAATGAKGNGDNNWWIATLDYIDARTGALRVIAAPRMQIDLPRVSPDGKSVAFIGGLMSDWGAIGGDVYVVPLAGGAPVDITPGYKGTFRGVAWRGKMLVTQALIDDRNAVVSLDPVSHATRVVWSAPVSVKAQNFDGAIALSGDGAVAATILEDFTHAPEIAMGRLPNLAPVTKDNAALAANVSAQSVHWNNEAYHVQGWLIGPKTVVPGKKYPMVVIVHGGPSSAVTPRYVVAGGQHGTGFDFTYDLIAKGAYIFYPNDRGSYGQGEAFTRANIRDFGRGDLRDMLAGIDAVEKIAPVDHTRLGLYGHSYGGWMAMWVNTQTHRFKAIVAGAGIADWTSYYGENGIDRWMVPFFGASVYDDPAVYRAASPIEFIKNAKTPTLIYVGERDVECPAPQSLEYWHALKEIGTTTELYIYAGEGHHFRKLTDLEDLRGRILGWYATYLK
ncbi:MAG TPA: LpqB family beta-propeller domain-containing protein [Rhizomicrobium sp.]|jgi:dipeptidyl aminopeptidase/acylaminoacyl peptidase|nr:LpqB family beta-propeller domain-containing protein [Rhizomicrobium sp.]